MCQTTYLVDLYNIYLKARYKKRILRKKCVEFQHIFAIKTPVFSKNYL
jgi:hypothetical protein